MSVNRVALRTYRALLTQTREIGSHGTDTLTLQLPVEGAWGHGKTYEGMQQHRRAMERYLGDLADSPETALLKLGSADLAQGTDARCSITLARLSATIRDRFKSAKHCSQEEAGSHIDSALKALRILSEQTHLLECSSESVTQGVRVEVTSAFQRQIRGDLSMRDRVRYIFTYRARVHNVGNERVKILGRGWVVHNDSSVYITVPKGSPGVVGCTPILKPGDSFEYHSGTDLDTRSGFIEGSFQMAVLDAADRPQRRFDAVVPPFKLIGFDSAAPAAEHGPEEEFEIEWED